MLSASKISFVGWQCNRSIANLACWLQATQEQSVSVPQEQPSQLALPKPLPPLRALDLAQVPSQPAQTQAHQVDAVYAELVEKMRNIVHKLQEHGHSPELDAQLEQQCSVMVSRPACWFVYCRQVGHVCMFVCGKLGFEASYVTLIKFCVVWLCGLPECHVCPRMPGITHSGVVALCFVVSPDGKVC